MPADWVRTRDPFQGVDKKDFGFKLVLTVDPPEPKKPGAMSAKSQGFAKVAKVSTANLVLEPDRAPPPRAPGPPPPASTVIAGTGEGCP